MDDAKEVAEVRVVNQPWPTARVRAITRPAVTLESTNPVPVIMPPQGYRWQVITYRAVIQASATVGTRAINMRIRDMSQPLFSATGAPGTNILGTVYGETAEIGPTVNQVGLIAGFPAAGPAAGTGADVPSAVTAANYNVAFGGAIVLQDQLALCVVDRSAIDTTDTVRWTVMIAEQRFAPRGDL